MDEPPNGSIVGRSGWGVSFWGSLSLCGVSVDEVHVVQDAFGRRKARGGRGDGRKGWSGKVSKAGLFMFTGGTSKQMTIVFLCEKSRLFRGQDDDREGQDNKIATFICARVH